MIKLTSTRLAISLLLCWALPALAQTPLPALSEEERQTWAAVGRINVAGYRDRSFCTGTLVAPTKVLTAAHCMVWEGAPRALPRITFVAGWDRGEMVTFRRTTRLELHPQFDLTRGRVAQPAWDLAVLTLDKPITERQLPSLPLAPLVGTQSAAIVGYHRVRPEVLNGRFDCAFDAVRLRIATLDCPVIAGNSGAPVLQQTDEGWRVVAVVSARPSAEGDVGAIITRLDPWLTGALAD
ncbi:trypsin-like serine peptidase [Pseudaestuariivita sp.]|uniref:trypsin-like serine peptidase n=1 Tax=Pseudaestuariivita sp. TaxID=2211669 RepID=UPI004059AE33